MQYTGTKGNMRLFLKWYFLN